mmetsp:Transcript_34377/g.65695  ORF Transcript_34377/g.65695 Transcript_34377/m.65695 type:complete len:407 (-) Transcript_34377:280-1500(-)|eukprot:CAMPEP_0114249910 /NCGR_PEP_ID=MMETSP0058-20121206/14413_1 /TAXON_ID=36894 /ORGANISM="Pyramimonas parkeae, CCMP726" /LENGTH=406 /DNA_ID=CAMNT_0001363525 /DNA_START=74 /DNA_END=1294 /DNA_ORIENTATION=-
MSTTIFKTASFFYNRSISVNTNGNAAKTCRPLSRGARKSVSTSPAGFRYSIPSHIKWRIRASKGDDAFEDNDQSDRPELDFSKLSERVQALRREEVAADRVAAHNWRCGQCTHTVFSVLNEYVRQIKLVGETLACGTTIGTCYLINIKTGQIQAKLEGLESEITCLDYDGRYVAAGGSQGEVWIWDAATHKGKLICQHEDRCIAAQLMEAGSGKVQSACLAGRVCLSDGAGSQDCFATNSPMGCMQVVDGYIIAGTPNGQVVVWASRNYKQILKFSAHESPVMCLQMMRDEELKQDVLVTGGADGKLRSWDFNQGRELRTFVGHRAPVTCLKLDSSKIVSCSRDGSIRVWDLRSGESLFGLYGYTAYVQSLQFEKNILISDGTNNALGYHDFAETLRVRGDDDLDC